MEYMLMLVVLLVVWRGAYWLSPAEKKRWTFWGGLITFLSVVYFQFVLHPYRWERILFDISKIF